MSDPSVDTGSVLHADENGVVGEHPQATARPFFASPALGGQANTLAMDIRPIACLNLGDILFEFDSSVVREPAGALLAQLPGLRQKYASPSGDLPVVSVFGHADPTGTDNYNKTLSGRRSTAVYALLVHNPSLWDTLYNTPFGGDNWSKKMDLSAIATRVGLPAGSSRQDIFTSYMQLLCPQPLDKTDFLGRGADSGGKADYQGCGEFNPLLMLSAPDLQTMPNDVRDAANLINRRVVIFLFRPELKIAPASWPCPTATEGVAGCRARFFLNAKQRLTPGPTRRRHYGPLDETFACRFYDRLAANSPCEQILRMYKIRLFDPYATPLPGASYTISDGKRTVTGLADSDAYATITDLKVPATVDVTWTDTSDSTSQYNLTVYVDVEGDDDDAAKQRLHNLGYENFPELADNVRAFQQDQQDRFPDMQPTGELDDATRAALRQVNAECDPSQRPKDPDSPNPPPGSSNQNQDSSN
jgi:hypothetical protein